MAGKIRSTRELKAEFESQAEQEKLAKQEKNAGRGSASRTGSSRHVVGLASADPEQTQVTFGWPITAIAAALLTGITTWLLVALPTFLAWTQMAQIDPVVPAHLAAQGWLLAHGVPIALPGSTMTLVPWGATIINALVAWGWCSLAVRRTTVRSAVLVKRSERVGKMTAVFTATYTVIALIVHAWAEPAMTGRALVGPLFFAAIVSGLSFAKAWKWRPKLATDQRRWLAIGPAIGAALAVMVVIGSLVVIAALINGRGQISTIQNSLGMNAAGGIALAFAQLAWLPNYIAWGAAWAAGSGVQLGLGSIISPAQTDVGMLPAIPVLGAVPPAGPVPASARLWVLSTFVAGAVAAWVYLRELVAERQAEGKEPFTIEVLAILGIAAGVGSSLALIVVEWLMRGDLGTMRLVDLGARLGPMAIMVPSAMGIAGLATAIAMSVRLGLEPHSTAPLDAPLDDTEALDDDVIEADSYGEPVNDAIPAPVVYGQPELHFDADEEADAKPAEPEPAQPNPEEPAKRRTGSTLAQRWRNRTVAGAQLSTDPDDQH